MGTSSFSDEVDDDVDGVNVDDDDDDDDDDDEDDVGQVRVKRQVRRGQHKGATITSWFGWLSSFLNCHLAGKSDFQ